MPRIDDSLSPIRDFHKKVGTRELSRLTGVPYTSLRDLAARDFGGPAIDVLKKLEAAALRHRAGTVPPKGVEAA